MYHTNCIELLVKIKQVDVDLLISGIYRCYVASFPADKLFYQVINNQIYG